MRAITDRNELPTAMGEAPTICLSTVETAFLAGLLGGRLLVGVEDPFDGWLAEDAREALDRARAALADRGLIGFGPDGITIDTGVAALVGTWAHAEASLLVTSTAGRGQSVTRYFHLTRHLGIEQVPMADSTHRLTALFDAGAVCRRILLSLGIGSQCAAPGAGMVMPGTLFSEARAHALAAGADAAGELLSGAGLDVAACRTLAESLAHPVDTSALVAMAHRITTWEVGGVAFLEGEEGLWRMRPLAQGGESLVEVLPCDAAGARHEVRRAMNRVLPAPLPGVEVGGKCDG